MLNLFTFIFSFLTVCSNAFAHEGGHGPRIPGVGPRGGELTAIIPANEVDKGNVARVSGVAEWKLNGSHLTVYLRTRDSKTPASVSASEMKWIFLGKALRPPIVLKVALPNDAAVLEIDLPPGTETAEAILANFNSEQTKNVFAVPLVPNAH